MLEKHGAIGYLVFFGVLEIYAREFKTEDGWNLDITLTYLRKKLQQTRNKPITNALLFIHDSHKWEVAINDGRVTIYIKKFKNFMSEATLKKLRKESGECPERDGIKDAEVDAEVDAEEDKKGAGAPDCPHKEIIGLYHQILSELRAVKVWNDDRQSWLRARWREDPRRQNLEWWREYFELVRKCPHLMGNNDRQWQADLEWLIRPQNMPKVLEGRYKRAQEGEDPYEGLDD